MGFTAGCEGLNSSKSTITRQINTPGILNICIFVTRAAKIYFFRQKSLIEFLLVRRLLLGTILVTMSMLDSKPRTCSSSTGYFCSLPNPHCHTIPNLYCYGLYLCPISFKGFHMWFYFLSRYFKFSFISYFFYISYISDFLFSRSTFSYLCFSMSRINKITR